MVKSSLARIPSTERHVQPLCLRTLKRTNRHCLRQKVWDYKRKVGQDGIFMLYRYKKGKSQTVPIRIKGVHEGISPSN
jgi:hypothetical protein